MSDDLKNLDKLAAVANFYRTHANLTSQADVRLADEMSTSLTRAHAALKESVETTRKLADAMEQLAVERSSNRKARVALVAWDELFSSHIDVIRVNAGPTVSTAVTLTRQALGKS